jgi:monovalent cation/hydrogen antiporter
VALAIPLTVEGREEIIFLTICVIVTTLVLQGLTLEAIIRRLSFPDEVPDERRQAMTRFRTIEAALEYVGGLSMDQDGVDESAIERARALYAQRANQLAGECRDGVPDVESDTAAWLRLRIDLLDIERARLTQLRNEGSITTPLMLAVQEDIDLEANRLQRRMATA